MFESNFEFAKITNIEDVIFDNSLNRFYSNGIEGTIKEDLQNALDARLKESNQPVKVIITLDEVESSRLPGIVNVFKHIQSLKGANEYTKKTIEYMKSKSSVDRVNVLTIEDQNTKGLTGAENGQSGDKKDTFGIYAYNKGVHFVDNDSDFETTRGGSHGIGKIANNAASDIHLIYFANCDAEGKKHVGGTIQLIEHQLDNQAYRSTGYFSKFNSQDGKNYPYENNFDDSIFAKNSRGLKIIIPYVRQEFFKAELIIKAVCDNFFMAILQNNLIVEVNEKYKSTLINKESLQEVINQHYETDYKEMKKNFTPLYLSTYSTMSPQLVTVNNGMRDFNFKLYFQYDERIVAGRVGIIRTIGMKIEDYKVLNHAKKPYNAILIGGQEEDEYLKSLENESHTAISADVIRDTDEKKRAKKFLRNLNSQISQIISEFMKKNNPTDGFINTDDLLYETEAIFTSELEKHSEKVRVANGDIVIKKVAKEERKSAERKKQDEGFEDQNTQRKRKAVKKKAGNSSNDMVDEFIIPSNVVERISLSSKEIIRINIKDLLPNQPIYCNLSFRVIDGMGKEADQYFLLNDTFEKINDLNTHTALKFDNYKIYNVSINDNEINVQIQGDLTKTNQLKFLYEIEVKK